MGMVRFAAMAAVALTALAAPAAAQTTPRTGAWLEPGAYCARGVRAVVPDGAAAISFGNGVEIARAKRGPSVLELNSFPRRGGMPSFDAFVTRMQLPCKDGFRSSETITSREASGLSTLNVLERRCVGPSTSYGLLFARAELVADGGDHDASVLVLYGDEPFRMGRVTFDEKRFFAETDASELFETVTAGLAPCELQAPPPPPPPPAPTPWLGAGARCAFTIGATVPEGFEFRFNGLASNGGVIDLRLAGVEERYHRSQIFVWPLWDDALEPPEESAQFNRCARGFEPRRVREALAPVDETPMHFLLEGCFSTEGQSYGRIEVTRLVSLPSGVHRVRGAFSFGSPDLPRRLSWTEYKSLTEPQVRTVIDSFIRSMRACEG